MDLLTHVNIKVTGIREQLDDFRGQVNRLLSEEYTGASVEEHHGDDALRYDLKVTGGIPFPAFVTTSREHPELVIAVEWVNAEAGVKGFAMIENGALKASRTEKLEAGLALPDRTAISLKADGRLALALTFLTFGPREFLGYALTSNEDALIRIVRAEDRVVDLYASEETGAQWDKKWRINFDDGGFEHQMHAPPEAMAASVHKTLKAHAEQFVASWMWFDSGSEEKIAIERERYRLSGYPIALANLKYSKLKTLMGNAPALDFSTLGNDYRWLKDIVESCWVRD